MKNIKPKIDQKPGSQQDVHGSTGSPGTDSTLRPEPVEGPVLSLLKGGIIFGIFFLAGMILWAGPVIAVPSPEPGDTFVGDAADPAGDAAVQNVVPVTVEGRDPGRPNLFQSGIRMMTALIVVIGIMLLVAYGARRFLARKGTLPGKEAMIRILATRYLGSKNSLSVVDVDGERFVIGLSPQGISFLTALSNLPETGGEDGGENSFRKILRRNLNEG